MSVARRWLLAALLLTSFGTRAAAQDAAFRELPLRVIAHRGRFVVVDRGERDHVEVGDSVWLYPRGADSVAALVRRVAARNTELELIGPGVLPPVGTRGVVLLPLERLAKVPQAPAPALPELPPWANEDSEFTPDQPLLAGVDVLHPAERPMRMGGRLYFSQDSTWYSESDRSDSYSRAGFDVFWENPFGEGGVLEFDGELSQRRADLPDFDGEDRGKGRLDRLSYTWGGTRFEDQRHQVGRFLQHGLPEFGVLDGYEAGRRLDANHSVGASIGYMPEPDRDQHTGEDFQVAGWYRWSQDVSERFTVTTGYQKTWHDGDADRDLIVAKVQVLPAEGWTVFSTAWIDVYRGDDVNKGSGPELTRLRTSAVRRDDQGGGQALSFTHSEYPELLRDEFPPVTAAQLADDRRERVSWDNWWQSSPRTRTFINTGVWTDEDDSGGDLEAGVDVDRFLGDDGHAHASAFLTRGAFSEALGARLGYGWDVDDGAWNLNYDVARHENLDFDDTDFAETIQHALRLSRDLILADEWDLRASLEARRWDEETSWAASMYLQKRF
ncbi:MAG: hypothetical protein DHS20C15_29950 [Planctomycetota bacterium]|nr:MAG: hypothetical protein DHS20C15_29950 [Planctomycetota bacterium]